MIDKISISNIYAHTRIHAHIYIYTHTHTHIDRQILTNNAHTKSF